MDFDKFLDALSAFELGELKRALKKREGPGAVLTSTEMAQIIKGDIISAIKSVRQRTNLGLVEAKDLVDRFRYHKGE